MFCYFVRQSECIFVAIIFSNRELGTFQTPVFVAGTYSARTCILPWVFFLNKANHYDNFDCYTLGNAKPVVGTSENVAEPDYDVIKMAAILNFNTNLRCFIISIIVGLFQFFRYQNVQNDRCCLLTPKEND